MISVLIEFYVILILFESFIMHLNDTFQFYATLRNHFSENNNFGKYNF